MHQKIFPNFPFLIWTKIVSLQLCGVSGSLLVLSKEKTLKACTRHQPSPSPIVPKSVSAAPTKTPAAFHILGSLTGGSCFAWEPRGENAAAIQLSMHHSISPVVGETKRQNFDKKTTQIRPVVGRLRSEILPKFKISCKYVLYHHSISLVVEGETKKWNFDK